MLFFVLALALAYIAVADSISGSSPSGQATPKQQRWHIYGNTTTANPQSPQGSAPAAQPLPGIHRAIRLFRNSSADPAGSATDASGGGVAGAAGSGTAPAQVPGNAAVGWPAISDWISIADSKCSGQEPTLSGEFLFRVAEDKHPNRRGNVGTGRKELTCGPNRPVVRGTTRRWSTMSP